MKIPKRPLLIFCGLCHVGYAAIAGPIPETCPRCGAIGQWSTTPPYHLTVDDRAFLKELRIRA